LWFDLPGTYRLLVAVEIGEYVAPLVVTETRHLDARTDVTWTRRSPHRPVGPRISIQFRPTGVR
jgi:hypothetical protein